MNVRAQVKGIKELQKANERRIAALQPSGKAGAALQWGTMELFRYLVRITHVVTGSLKASRRQAIEGHRGRLFTDPGATNPRSGVRTIEYDQYEEKRGGTHAAWQRTFTEAGPRVGTRMTGIVLEGLK